MPRKIKSKYAPRTTDQRIGYFIEECGEALHAAGKSLRWGLRHSNPETPLADRKDNAQLLREEIWDLKRAIKMLERDLNNNY